MIQNDLKVDVCDILKVVGFEIFSIKLFKTKRYSRILCDSVGVRFEILSQCTKWKTIWDQLFTITYLDTPVRLDVTPVALLHSVQTS